MDLGDTKLFGALKQKMTYDSQRQAVIAENIANANVPGYRAKDMKKIDFGGMVNSSYGKLRMTATDANHMTSGSSGGGRFGVQEDKNAFDITPTGNSVVLEEQAMKMAENNMDYQQVTSVYRKMMDLFRLAVNGNSSR